MAAGGLGTKAVVVALLASTATAGAATAVSVETGSATLLAIGTLAGASAGSDLLALLGGRRARREADDQHPFGHGRERWYGSFAVGVVLALLAAVHAVDLGIRRIDEPEPITGPEWAWGALGGGLLLALIALRVAAVQGNDVRGRATWRRFVRHAKVPALPLVIVQQVAAVVALLAGLGAVAAVELADEPTADGIGAVVVGGVMGVLALVLLGQVRSLLIGHTATRRDVEIIRAAVEIDPAVQALLHLRTQHQGPEELLVGMKVELDHTLTFPEVSEVVQRIERNVRRAAPQVRTMYIEPDVTDARRAAPTIGEHVPGSDVPEEIRAKQKIEDERFALGVGIPIEDEPS